MMDMIPVLDRLCAAPGVTGCEGAAAAVAEELFSAYTRDVWRDRAGSVYARIGSGRPVVLIAAHIDEIGMMVTEVLEDGFVRFGSVAGADPRTLPGSQVVIDGREPVPGVVGAIPPHLQRDRAMNYRMDELTVDTGLSTQRLAQLVRVGDTIRFRPEPVLELKNRRAASKTFDDRAHVAAMLRAMELLSRQSLACTVVFCATVQEEFGSIGASLAAHSVDPDMAVAIDVSHAVIPGSTRFDSFPLDKPTITCGSNIHPGMLAMLREAADFMGVEYETEVDIGATGTDAWDIQVARSGIPCALMSTPVKYMHTSVELLSLDTLENVAKVLARFIAAIGDDWEDRLCWKD